MMTTSRILTAVAVTLLLGCAGGDETATEPPDPQATEATESTEATEDDGSADEANEPDEPGEGTEGDDSTDDAIGEPDGSADDVAVEDEQTTAAGDEDGRAAAATGDSEAFGGVTLTLEPLLEISWDEIDDAFDYEVSVDGDVQGTPFSPPYLLLDETGEVTVEAFDFEDETLGPVAADVAAIERFVVQWDPEAIPSGYVGLSAPTYGQGWTSASSPHLIQHPPDDIELVLFGEPTEVEEQEADGTTTTSITAPFEFEFDEIIEHGPYIELPLPELP